MKENSFLRRIQNIAYSRAVKKLLGTRWEPGLVQGQDTGDDESNEPQTSISASSEWVKIAAAVGSGAMPSAGMRRLFPVMDIVETVPPGDGMDYAKLVRGLDADFLTNENVWRVDRWGDPIRWPGSLLATPCAFSSTTLRYLATALWLRDRGLLEEGGSVVEIGVGFGGLAAMNKIVSGAKTMPVDLPEVEALAGVMMEEVGLGGSLLEKKMPEEPFTLISNYAFTELNTELQDLYFEKWIRHSHHGLIVSNANIFSRAIGGRDDTAILAMLESAGLAVTLLKNSDFLCSSDYVCDVSAFIW